MQRPTSVSAARLWSVCTRALRTVQIKGGLDAFLLKTADVKLAPTGLKLKRQLKKALAKS